jgi:hypothetical protein
MTITPERIAELRALALAATPGEWRWHTGCSWRRLTAYDDRGRYDRDGNVACPYVASDGHPDMSIGENDQAFIAAFNPQTALALLDALSAQSGWREGVEAAARVATKMFPRGGAHTYASENADAYRAQEHAAEQIAAAIRALQPPVKP